MLKWKIQYISSLLMILIGILIYFVLYQTIFTLLGIMLAVGGLIICISYAEQKWVKRKYLKWGLLSTVIFAIVYGILEYVFFDSTWNNWFKISEWFPSKYYYWGFMAILNFTIVIITSRGSFALSITAIPLFSVNEDLFYWISKSIHEMTYVFPVDNWFDTKFPFLKGLGEPIPVMPYWPRFYFVGWILVSALLIIQLKKYEGKKFIVALIVFITLSFLCLLLVPSYY